MDELQSSQLELKSNLEKINDNVAKLRATLPKPENTLAVTVFYAWQSDRPEKVSKDFIRLAAEAAAKRITDDQANNWTVTIDSDTRGVVGMCDIPAVILEKIAKADIFVGDLTIVGKTDELNDKGEPKLLPNANVLFELGYAGHALGFEVLVGVMNEAFGTIHGQVFDIKKRDCLKYTVASDATKSVRRGARNALSKELEDIFRATIETIVVERRKTILISAGFSHGVKGDSIYFEVTNPKSKPFPAYSIALYHPKKGSFFGFPSEDSGPLEQDQLRQHYGTFRKANKNYGVLSWILSNDHPDGFSEADNDDFTFRLVLDKSKKVLYEDKRIGVALAKFLYKQANGSGPPTDWRELRNYPYQSEYVQYDDDGNLIIDGKIVPTSGESVPLLANNQPIDSAPGEPG